MIELNPTNFEKEVLKSKKHVAVMFYNSFAAPALELAPVFEKASAKHADMNFAKLDVEKHTELAAKFINVEAEIPSIPFFKDGDEVDRILGACSEYALDTKIGGFLMIKK